SNRSVVYQLKPILVFVSPWNVVMIRFGLLFGSISATSGFSSDSSLPDSFSFPDLDETVSWFSVCEPPAVSSVDFAWQPEKTSETSKSNMKNKRANRFCCNPFPPIKMIVLPEQACVYTN